MSAQGYMPAAQGKRWTLHRRGNTRDIVSAVLGVYQMSRTQTRGIAESFRASSDREAARRIWTYIKRHVPYEEDPFGEQLIKTPARTLSDARKRKPTDCKSYSILAASILHNLRLPHSFRFVSFERHESTVTHVYVILHTKNGYIPIDAVLSYFGEKPFHHKQDFYMSTHIQALSGIGAADIDSLPRETTFDLDDSKSYSDEQLELLLIREQMALEGMIALRKGKNTSAKKYAALLKPLNEAVVHMNNADALQAIEDQQVAVSGLRTGLKKLVSKVKQSVKKANQNIKGALIRTALTVALPGAAALFIYLFVKDDSILPAGERKKKQKFVSLAHKIRSKLGISEQVFMKAIRNGIMKKTGSTPEAILQTAMRRGNSVGAIPALVPVLTKAFGVLLGFVKKLFGGTGGAPGKDDIPDLGLLKQIGETAKKAFKKASTTKGSTAVETTVKSTGQKNHVLKRSGPLQSTAFIPKPSELQSSSLSLDDGKEPEKGGGFGAVIPIALGALFLLMKG